jgi:hypothetical protein
MISKVLRDLSFSWNQPLKSADDQYTRILKNKLIKLKKQEDRILWLGHGTCSYICVYVNWVANSVILQLHLRHDFYNIIFEIRYKICSLRVSPPQPLKEKFWVRTCSRSLSRAVWNLLASISVLWSFSWSPLTQSKCATQANSWVSNF